MGGGYAFQVQGLPSGIHVAAFSIGQDVAFSAVRDSKNKIESNIELNALIFKDGKKEHTILPISKIRVAVQEGANLGNQSAALSLLLNLRRVGYQGPIEVLTGKQEREKQTETWQLTYTFNVPIQDKLEEVKKRQIDHICEYFNLLFGKKYTTCNHSRVSQVAYKLELNYEFDELSRELTSREFNKIKIKNSEMPYLNKIQAYVVNNDDNFLKSINTSKEELKNQSDLYTL